MFSSTTVKKGPKRTRTLPFAFPDQASQALNCNRAAVKRQFADANNDQTARVPVDVPSKTEMLAMEIAMGLSGYEKEVI